MTERPNADELARWESEGGALAKSEPSTKRSAVSSPIAFAQDAPSSREKRLSGLDAMASNDN
jgi:hypothetical protein